MERCYLVFQRLLSPNIDIRLYINMLPLGYMVASTSNHDIVFPFHSFSLCIFLSMSTDSTFKFLLEQWKEQLPPGYLLQKASVDQPFEEDACFCHFDFVRDINEESGAVLNLKYQWLIGERTPSNFIAIPGACGEV